MSASGKFVSLNWNVSGGGAFALLPLASPGKLPDLYPLCRGHTSAVLDTAFSPFDDEVIVSGGDDAHLSLWRVSPDDVVQRLDAAKDTGTITDIKPQASFLAGKRRVWAMSNSTRRYPTSLPQLQVTMLSSCLIWRSRWRAPRSAASLTRFSRWHLTRQVAQSSRRAATASCVSLIRARQTVW